MTEVVPCRLDDVPDGGSLPLDETDGRYFVCATHGARFRLEDGRCVDGPCAGAALTPIEIELRDGLVRLAER